MRALEVGRPVVRATNTGISTFISADGALGVSVQQFAAGAVTGDVVPRQGLTPYAKFGNVPSIALVLIVIAWFAWRAYAKRINQSTD
jgi:apolipoprotein N-acyltransferase